MIVRRTNKREMCITAARADDKVTTSDLNPLFYHLDFQKRHYLRSLNAINILHDVTQSEDVQVQNGLTRIIIFSPTWSGCIIGNDYSCKKCEYECNMWLLATVCTSYMYVHVCTCMLKFVLTVAKAGCALHVGHKQGVGGGQPIIIEQWFPLLRHSKLYALYAHVILYSAPLLSC